VLVAQHLQVDEAPEQRGAGKHDEGAGDDHATAEEEDLALRVAELGGAPVRRRRAALLAGE